MKIHRRVLRIEDLLQWPECRLMIGTASTTNTQTSAVADAAVRLLPANALRMTKGRNGTVSREAERGEALL